MTAPPLNRRSFLKATASAGALLMTILCPRVPGARTRAAGAGAPPWCVYVTIHPDNTVTMHSPVVEMGQFMRTTGPMIIADEMDLDWSLITFTCGLPVLLTRNADGEVVYDHARVNTGGSQTVVNNWDYMRTAGATVRRMLIEEAAARWQVSPESLSARDNFVVDAERGRRLSYGALAEHAALRKVAADGVRLKDRSEYRIMGRDAGVIDIHNIVTGKPLYGLDEDYPGALQAVIDRAPAIGAEIAGYDREAALAIPGVRDIVEMERQDAEHYWPDSRTQVVAAGVAVVADSLWAALRGKAALKTRWKNTSDYANQNSGEQIRSFHRLLASDKPAEVVRNDGDAVRAIESADLVLDETYEKPLYFHACMEPHNCIVDIREDSATVVVGHQVPHLAALEVERVTGIDALAVEVVPRRMGGSFGRKGEQDILREAVALALKVGQPVKLTWMREDEMERDYFGPASVTRVRGALKDRQISGWHHRQAQTKGHAEHICFPGQLVADYRVERFPTTSIIPGGSWRGPMQLQWAFAAESMIDELAHAAGEDALAFRLKLMGEPKAYKIDFWASDVIDSGRMAACYRTAAELAEWHRKRPAGTGLGIAGHFTFGTYAAWVVEVAVNEDEVLDIRNAWGAIDCGLAINPNHIRAQMEGGLIDGLNAALFNKAIIKNGRVQNNNFDAVRWMRMREAPRDIEVGIVDSGYGPSGVGEPPVAPAGAALANAIFAACGKRIRRMPIADSITI